MPKAQPQKSQQNIAMAKNSLVVAALALLALCSVIQAAPYQELEPRKGHVPVYIRHGNEPLSDIHPGLAEAFKEEGLSKALEAESLVTEIPEAAAASSPTTSAPATSSTESDIASFETIKAQAKE
ncbi:uncharacterized protein LOC117893948 [Drosophila subobscura]|uniref:uncharacterized protein LOC117893948 n=1 Tax=Drosophila subobscura TaxID=7241 RepID=UPI00155A410F|nr:uncharacterized protein LOC117893948 [Drosophila subobscura]